MGTILVTGGGSGIGQAIATALVKDGHRVVVAGRTIDRLLRVAYTLQQNGGQVLAVAMDVTSTESVAAAVTRVHEVWGPVTGLVNNAGIGAVGSVLETPIDELRRVLEVNLVGAYRVTQAFLPDLLGQGGGPVVNVASVVGMVGVKDRAAYAASKAALLGLTRSIHADFYAQGIRANAVVPGSVATGWIDRIAAMAPNPELARKEMEQRQPIGRLGKPEEVAAAVRFLISDDSAFMYGSWVVVDGGMTAL
jgi:NAD(P)-dependent dehydrogenase (short-subunit alcohol dehydrogenase family)